MTKFQRKLCCVLKYFVSFESLSIKKPFREISKKRHKNKAFNTLLWTNIKWRTIKTFPIFSPHTFPIKITTSLPFSTNMIHQPTKIWKSLSTAGKRNSKTASRAEQNRTPFENATGRFVLLADSVLLTSAPAMSYAILLIDMS